MKKKLTYRDKLLELAKIYNVKEIQEYIRNRKNLTSGQIELILRKNKIIIPKDFQTNFFKENFTKPLNKISRRIDDIKEDSSRTANRVSRKITYFKEDSSRSFYRFIINSWRSVGLLGLGFLNVFPKAGQAIYDFVGKTLTNLFHGIYDQQINKNKAGKVVVVFFVIVGAITIIVSGVTTFNNLDNSNKKQIVKKEEKIKKPEVKIKKEVKKPELKVEPKKKVKKEIKKKEKVIGGPLAEPKKKIMRKSGRNETDAGTRFRGFRFG